MKSNLRSLAIAVIFCSTVYVVGCKSDPADTKIAHLVGCYPFSSGAATDESGYQNNGTLTHVTPAADRFGHETSALYFNGTAFITLPPEAFLSDNYTYSVWAKLDALPQEGDAFNVLSIGQAYDDAVATRPHQTLDVSNVYASVGASGWSAGGFNLETPNTSGSLTNELPDVNVWYHLASVRSDSTITLYVNGVAFPAGHTGTSKPDYGLTHAAMVGIRSNMTQPFIGTIDDLSIFDAALTATQIKALYENGLACKSTDVAN